MAVGLNQKIGRKTILSDNYEEDLANVLQDTDAHQYDIAPADLRHIGYSCCEKK